MAEISFTLGTGRGQPKRSDGSGTTSYDALEISLGVRRRFSWNGTVIGEIAFNRLSGNEYVLGSHRELYLGRVGYRQSYRFLFAETDIGAGYNNAHINFGGGTVPLPHDQGMPVVLTAKAGAQYCFGKRPCVEAFVSQGYEKQTVGGPDYSDRPWMAGLGFSFDLGRTASYDEYRAALDGQERLRADLTSRTAERDKARDDLAKAQAITVAEPDRSPTIATECTPPPLEKGYPPIPQKDVAALLVDDPIGSTVVPFANESTDLFRTENRSHAAVTDRLNPQLEPVVRYLKDHPDRGMIVEGHANGTGPEDQNTKISATRAEAVARELRKRGVSDRQIVKIDPRGSKDPIDPRNPADPINRAVRFREVPLQ